MITLCNSRIRIGFDEWGRLAALSDAAGTVAVPIEAPALTEVFTLELRSRDGVVTRVSPQAPPLVQQTEEADGQALTWTWRLSGDWGALDARARVVLPPDSPVSLWTLAVENHADQAIWQVTYPRVSGLAAFPEGDGPDWLAAPFHMGEKTPAPVRFVNHHVKRVGTWARSQDGCFDDEGGPGDIAYTYPGMWGMQYLAYGHPAGGGIYFAAHDPQSLYKRFGMYADGGDGRHAALMLRQYPEDRAAAGASFASFYPAAVGVYAGEWWEASAIYREWALQQEWCRRGPTREREDIPTWAKEADLWYWNWQTANSGHPRRHVPAIEYLKERFGCEIAFHWYGSNGEVFNGGWRSPEEYPADRDIRETLVAAMRRLHAGGIRAIPYVNARLWCPDTHAFREADGMSWVVADEHGKPHADEWAHIGLTTCPTAPPFQEVIRRVTNQMIDGCEMDGAYLDQITACYALPCFQPSHDHAPGGHDHWCRGYRQMLEKVRADIKQRSVDNVITSESVIECYLDLLDLDLSREISGLRSRIGCPGSLPIPMFHSVYHDYHLTYGTVQTFQERNPDLFRYGEALCLVGGGQLGVSGFFTGDERKPQAQPYLEYMEMLSKAHVAARAWLNLGVWKPPAAVACECVAIAAMPDLPPTQGIPAVLSGCFLLDGEVCVVLVNHTQRPQQAVVTLPPAGHGMAAGAFSVRRTHPGPETDLGRTGPDGDARAFTFDPASAQILVLRPVA
ncbi:MAG: hypothetical protein HY321_01430 [Armatimonadetes bacterium]|nr:hypothetical protein [Armatimonadota bacterium]